MLSTPESRDMPCATPRSQGQTSSLLSDTMCRPFFWATPGWSKAFVHAVWRRCSEFLCTRLRHAPQIGAASARKAVLCWIQITCHEPLSEHFPCVAPLAFSQRQSQSGRARAWQRLPKAQQSVRNLLITVEKKEKISIFLTAALNRVVPLLARVYLFM